jgi:cyclophilin family peptidyl-prolyl cis-trans isomerase
VKRSAGRLAVSRKMQRSNLLKTAGALLLILGLIAVLRQNDPFPGVRKAAMRHRRETEKQRDFRDPADAESPDAASASEAEEGDAENNLEDGGRIFTFELESLTDGGKGKVVIETKPSWAPVGVQHFHELMDDQFYEQAKFFRVVTDFVVQFGIAADPAKAKPEAIKDDPVIQTNARGTLTYATSGPNTRSTQLFINTRNGGNGGLDRQGFAPIAEVIRYVSCLVERIFVR